MTDEEPRFIQMGRTIDDGLSWTEETAIQLLAGLPPDRLSRVIDEALARIAIDQDIRALELGEDTQGDGGGGVAT